MIKNQRRIPTLLGLLIVFIGIGATAFLVENFQNTRIQANPSIVPQDLKITNLLPTGFTISWITGEKTQGFVSFGKELTLEKTVFDQRDTEEDINKYYTHYVRIQNLKPSTNYYFKIISQGKTFDQQGHPYEIKTTPSFANFPTNAEPAYGRVLDKNNKPAQGVLVYLTLKGALPLSALTKPSGNFLIPLSLAVNNNADKPFVLDPENEEEEIVIQAEPGTAAKALAQTKNDSPLPTIILGKSYDFRTQKDKQIKSLAEKGGLPQKVLGAKEITKKVNILFPKEENAPLLDSQPLFKGKGIPRTEVKIQINSPPITGKTAVDANGNWFFRPEKPLSPGTHTLTINTKNDQGEEITLSRKFRVLKSGSQVLGEATPSATLTPTTPPPTTTAVPTLTQTPTPTISSSQPALSPTPSIVAGFVELTIGFLGIGFLFLLLGIGVFFLSG